MRVIIHRVTDNRQGGPTLDMTPEGEFRTPPKPSWAQRVLAGAIVVAVLSTMLVIAALALWFALFLIPVALGAALVAYLAYRWRIWQARGRTDIYRP
jgi:uncharacterized RDD family membrane protein YckC